jgi:hypothetical protein
MRGRNAPCHCGSGKKFKDCCRDKPVAAGGPCNGPPGLRRMDEITEDEMCGRPSCGLLLCKHCEKRYEHCKAHESIIKTMMHGHALRVHPEVIPTKEFDRLLKNRIELERIYAEFARAPHFWQRLVDYIEERRKANLS